VIHLQWIIKDWLAAQSEYDAHASPRQWHTGEHLGYRYLYHLPKHQTANVVFLIKDASVRWIKNLEHMHLPESGIELPAADPEFFPKFYRMLRSYNDHVVGQRIREMGPL
jgi:hypothetical protein